MDAGYIVFMQAGFGSGPMLPNIVEEFGQPLLMLGIIMVSFLAMMFRLPLHFVMTVCFGGLMLANAESFSSLLVDVLHPAFEVAKPAPTAASSGQDLTDPMEWIAGGLTAMILVAAGMCATIALSLVVPEIYKNWKGWFEFRVTLMTLAFQFLYWKHGIKDPYARIMVDMDRMMKNHSYEPLSFPETVAAAIEHQPWMPWSGIVGDNDAIPADYVLVEVTMFDQDGIMDVDPQTVPYEKMDGLYWRPVPGCEVSAKQVLVRDGAPQQLALEGAPGQ